MTTQVQTEMLPDAATFNFTQLGASISRLLALKLYELVSVDDYYYFGDTDDMTIQRALNYALQFQYARLRLTARGYYLQKPITGTLRQHQFYQQMPGLFNKAQHLIIEGEGRDITVVYGNNTSGGFNLNFTNIYNNHSASMALTDTPALTPTSSYSKIIDSDCSVTVCDLWLAPNLDGAGVGCSYTYLAQAHQDSYGFWNGQRIGHTFNMRNVRFDPPNANSSFYAWNTSIDVSGALFPTFENVLCAIGNYASTKQQYVLNLTNCYGGRAYQCDFGSTSAFYGVYHVADTIVEAVKFRDVYSVGPDVPLHLECHSSSRGDEYNVFVCHFNGVLNNIELVGVEDGKFNDNLLYRNTTSQMQGFTSTNSYIVGNQLYLGGQISGNPANGMLVNGAGIASGITITGGTYPVYTLSASAPTTPSSSFTVTGGWSIANNILTITGSVSAGAIVAPTDSSTLRQYLSGAGITPGTYIVSANGNVANSYILSAAYSTPVAGTGLSGAAGIAISGSALFTASSWSVSAGALTLGGVVGTPAVGQLISGTGLNGYTTILSISGSGASWTGTVSPSQTVTGSGTLSGGIANTTNDFVLSSYTEAFSANNCTVGNGLGGAGNIINVQGSSFSGVVKQGQVLSGGSGFTGTTTIAGYIDSFYAPSFTINGTALTISSTASEAITNGLKVGQLLGTSPVSISSGSIPANTMVVSVSGNTAVLSNSIASCSGTGLTGTGGRGGVGTYLLDQSYANGSAVTITGTKTQAAAAIEILDNTHGFSTAVYTQHRHVNMLDGNTIQYVKIRYNELRAATTCEPFFIGNQSSYIHIEPPLFPENGFIGVSYPMNDTGNPAYPLPVYKKSAGAANVVINNALGLVYSDSGNGMQYPLAGSTNGTPQPITTTYYLGPNGAQTSNANAFLTFAASTLKTVSINLNVVPGANTDTFAVMVNGVAQPIASVSAGTIVGGNSVQLTGSVGQVTITLNVAIAALKPVNIQSVLGTASNIQYTLLLSA